MAGKKHRQLSVPNIRLRYVVMAAVGDLKALEDRRLGQAVVWLVNYAIAAIYRDRLTLARLLALSLYDEKYDWARADEPLEAFAEEALLDPQVVERILMGRAAPTNEQYSAIAGALDKDVDELMELPTKLEENGDVRERVNAD
jgi:transcriptional regulator with XRE-family HTH domain